MPSRTFLLSSANDPTPERLPVYSQTSPTTGALGCNASLPTILEMAEDGDDGDDDEKRSLPRYSHDGPPPPPFFAPSWDSSRLAKVEYSSMLPQALLVDASATLCAYLYFTSLQARLALQGQSSLDILSSVCNSMPDDADAGVMQICSKAMSKATASLAADSHTLPSLLLLSSHHFIIAMVLAKALLGYAIMRFGTRYIRPFDYLVASGAAHCLLLYFAFFVPVAAALDNADSVAASTVWLRVMTKFFWLLIISSCIGLAHWIATSGLRRDAHGTIELQEGSVYDDGREAAAYTGRTTTAEEYYAYLDEKDAVLLS